MSFNVAMLEALQAEGLDLDACIRVLRAGEKKADPTNAQRQARHRAKAKSNAVTVTPDAPPNDIYSNPPVTPLDNSSELSPPTEIETDSGLKPEHVVEAWNAMAQRHGLAVVRKLTPERRKKLASRIRQNTIDEFTEAITAIERSPFLLGENNRSWRADFDFLLNPAKFTKLIEGTYGH